MSSKSQIKGLCGSLVAIDKPNHDDSSLQGLGGVSHAVMASKSALWENGTVLDYSFFGGSQFQRKKVIDTIAEWSWYANITFKPTTDNNAKATIRITFDPKKGSWSYIGNTAKTCAGPAPTMNLGWIDDDNTISKKERGVILHEFGHVLGLMHEHESPARSGIIRLKEKEIIQYYSKNQGWDEATVRSQVLDVYSKDSVSNYSQFDPTSIMMYFMPGAMNEGGVDIHETTELSMFDKAFIVANYPRSKPHPSAPNWTPEFALTAAGAYAETIEAYNNTTDVDEKREIFSRDMLESRELENRPRQKVIVRNASKVPVQNAPNAPVQNALNVPVQNALNVPVQNALNAPVQNAPNVQTGFNTSFTSSPPNDDKFIQNIISQLDSAGPNTTVVKTGGVQYGANAPARAEMVQNGIFGLLFKIAPMVLFAPNVPVAPGSPYVAHAVLDPSSLRLEDPIVQHGLRSFFTQLASNDIVKKVMAGAVKAVGSVASEVVSGLFPQHAYDSSESSSSLETSDIQNGLMTDGLSVLVKKVLGHRVFQEAIKEISGLAAHNNVQHSAFVSSNSTSNLPYGGPQNAIQSTAHAEKVQNSIFSLLLDVAPKSLVAPNAPISGSSQVAHAVLDPNNLSLEHPVVQHGLMSFFTKLASNETVKKVMSGAVQAAKLAGNLASAALDEFLPQHALNTITMNPQNGLLTDRVAKLVKSIVDHKIFKDAIQNIRTAVIQNASHQDSHNPSSDGERAFRRHMHSAFAEILRRGGPQTGERILQQMEQHMRSG